MFHATRTAAPRLNATAKPGHASDECLRRARLRKALISAQAQVGDARQMAALSPGVDFSAPIAALVREVRLLRLELDRSDLPAAPRFFAARRS